MNPSTSLVVVVMGLSALVAGCGGGQGNGNVSPIITDASVTPSELRFTGGTVTIAAKATDDESVDQVLAVVEGPAGPSTLPLALSSDYYACDYSAPPNPGPADQVYSVEVRATDNRGIVSVPETRSFTVAAPPVPPETPPL